MLSLHNCSALTRSTVEPPSRRRAIRIYCKRLNFREDLNFANRPLLANN
ncbi:MAG: hypothetical protein PV344_04295 [Anaplasma sp.]|nr:hypothetical protein [Anaplasma sp.]